MLADICDRISCGVATGADAVYRISADELPVDLERFALPTLAGRDLKPGRPVEAKHHLLVPYTSAGELIAEEQLGALGEYLAVPERRRRLEARTCVRNKPWYAFHETPPMKEMLAPKLLCKDIGAVPFFKADPYGTILPRHSIYYIVPTDTQILPDLEAYLNSDFVGGWLHDHCQRAANGFLRLQSHVLKRLPIPSDLALRPQAELWSEDLTRQTA